MPGRTAALVGTLALIALLGGLTLNILITKGFDILVATSILILAMFSSGVVGALRNPPEE